MSCMQAGHQVMMTARRKDDYPTCQQSNSQGLSAANERNAETARRKEWSLSDEMG